MYVESQYVELKSELTKEIKKEIIAFANTSGGTIYIGIDDDGKIVGIKNASKDLESLSGMIREGIRSDLTLYTKIYIERISNKDVIIVKVESAPNKPYYLSDKGMKSSGVYLRYGTSSVPATDETIKKLLLENNSNSFEEQISNNQMLHFNYMNNLFENKNINLDETKYKTLHIKNTDNLYTNLGLLLSDECPFEIKVAIYNGNDKLEFKDRKEFVGSILKQVNDVFEYLELFNKTSGKIIGLERIDVKDYPDYALREALLNAVIHRDYNFKGSILISLYDDRFEIVSLGGLVRGISINDIYMGVSESRNPNLANIFFRLKYVESFGTGIGRILRSYDQSEKKPMLQESDNAFLVMLPNINYKELKARTLPSNLSQQEQIIQYLKKYNKISRIIVEEMFDVSKTRANDILNEMINKNLILKQGNGKNIIYILK